MKTVLYSSPFVPAEWIAAHGLAPKRVVPHARAGAPTVGVRPGMCPYARAFVDEVLAESEAAGVVFTTTCDQMRRAPELSAAHSDIPVFVMNVPATWQTAAAQRLYRDELRRLGRFLERLGGAAPSDERLTEVMLEYDAARAQASGTTASKGTRLALVGGPLLQRDFSLYTAVENAGGAIVLDATEHGERTLPARFDRRRIGDDPLGELADAYFGTIPDAFRRPDVQLHEWLGRELADRDVQGVIFHHYTWCDVWEAEAARLKTWCPVPVLVLSVGDGDGDAEGRIAGQVQAFLEVAQEAMAQRGVVA